MIRFKPEVRLERLSPAIAVMLDVAALWSLRARVDVRINSIDDGAPGRVLDTFHGFSCAIDFGTDDGARPSLEALARFMSKVLPSGYDVILESDHLHVECDPKRQIITKAGLPATPTS